MPDSAARHGIRFDPTFNVGQVGQIAALVFMVGGLWATFDARTTQNKDEIKRVEVQAVERAVSAENRLMREITTTQAGMNQTQVRTADDVREIKLMMRDGFKALEEKLDRKVDKPGR